MKKVLFCCIALLAMSQVCLANGRGRGTGSHFVGGTRFVPSTGYFPGTHYRGNYYYGPSYRTPRFLVDPGYGASYGTNYSYDPGYYGSSYYYTTPRYYVQPAPQILYADPGVSAPSFMSYAAPPPPAEPIDPAALLADYGVTFRSGLFYNRNGVALSVREVDLLRARLHLHGHALPRGHRVPRHR